MKVKAIIATALVAIVALAALGIGIGITNAEDVDNVTNQTPTPQWFKYHGFVIPDVETPVENVTIPQSFAPTNTFVEEGEVKYYGWKCDRDEPVVEKPELEPIVPIKPGCPHGYINPAFCWKCNA